MIKNKMKRHKFRKTESISNVAKEGTLLSRFLQRLLLFVQVVVAVNTFSASSFAQVSSDTSSRKFNLDQCIAFALENQALYQQSLIDREISERTAKVGLSSWYPQIRADGNLTHYMLVPVNFFPQTFGDPASPRVPYRFALPNSSNLLVEATQVIFSNEVLLAAKAFKYTRERADKNVERSRIDLVVSVSKAFYDILTTEQQLVLVMQNIERQRRLYNDTYSLYEAGVADKLDYRRTSIALNNSLSELKRVQESLHAKNTYMKQLIGFPMDQELKLDYDADTMEKEAMLVDTLMAADYNNRIEFQLLQAQMELQKLNLKYQRWDALPSLAGFINYNFLYQSREFKDLYNRNYPNSALGLRATIPIFTGGRRYQNIAIAKLQVQRLDKDISWFKDQVNTEYIQAMSIYKSNLNEFRTQEENLKIAQEVDELVTLQYEQGIKPYLDVISAESDLRATQFNYLNALYNLLESKLEVHRVLGIIK